MAEQDIDNMTLEELEAAMEQGAFEPAVQAEPVPEPEVVPDVPSETPEAPAVEPETAEAVPETVPDEDPAKLLLAEMEARAKHWEQVAGRNAGELGFIKQQIAELRKDAQRRPADDTEFGEQQPPRASEPPRRDMVAAWAVQQAAQQAAASFQQGRPDLNELQPDMMKYISDSGFNPEAVLLTDDPVQAARETTRALEEAYWHAKAAKTAARRVELEAKSADQTLKLAEAKKKAAVSAPSSVPPPKPRAKTPAEMSDDELEAELQRVTGGRW